MSAQSISVRARDGALYHDPLLVFPEGFLWFPPDDVPEMVLWDPKDDQPDEWYEEMFDRIARRFRRALRLSPDFIGNQSTTAMRVVPGTEPWEWRQACAFFVEVVGRIPVPTSHKGFCRYPRHCPGKVLDWPMHRLDVRDAAFDTSPEGPLASDGKPG